MTRFNWNEIYINTSPKLLGICRRYIKDIATAEDIIQDSFIVAIQKENTLKDANALNGWLSRIVINMAIHHLKNAKKINFSAHEDFEIADATTLMNTSETNNKSLLLSSDLDRKDILNAIDLLPEHHRSVFNMYVIDQFSHTEISKTLNISIGTSKSHLSRARKAIQLFLLEKIKGKPVDEKKRRRVAFLFFLGFGNQMFAHFYRNHFSGFEINPQRAFDMEHKPTQVPNAFIGLSKVALVSKLTIAVISSSFLLAAIVFCIHIYTPEPLSLQETNPLEYKPTENNITKEIIVKDTTTDKKITTEIDQPKIIAIPKKNTPLNKKTEKVLMQANTLSQSDSSKSEPQKVVVIKKQIIKKDTVYVTK